MASMGVVSSAQYPQTPTSTTDHHHEKAVAQRRLDQPVDHRGSTPSGVPLRAGIPSRRTQTRAGPCRSLGPSEADLGGEEGLRRRSGRAEGDGQARLTEGRRRFTEGGHGVDPRRMLHARGGRTRHVARVAHDRARPVEHGQRPEPRARRSRRRTREADRDLEPHRHPVYHTDAPITPRRATVLGDDRAALVPCAKAPHQKHPEGAGDVGNETRTPRRGSGPGRVRGQWAARGGRVEASHHRPQVPDLRLLHRVGRAPARTRLSREDRGRDTISGRSSRRRGSRKRFKAATRRWSRATSSRATSPPISSTVCFANALRSPASPYPACPSARRAWRCRARPPSDITVLAFDRSGRTTVYATR